MFGLGFQELIVILFIILTLFGANQIPKIARGIGEGLKEFKKAAKDAGRDPDDGKKDGGPGDKELKG